MKNNNIVLIGFMGSGKSALGRILAKRLSMAHRDMDTIIEETAGKTITEIFADSGEAGFRDMETAVLRNLTGRGEAGAIYSTGGGIVVRPENRELLKKLGTVVLLDVSAEEVLRRLSHDTKRPLLQTDDRETRVSELMQARSAAYHEAADLVLDVNGKTKTENVDALIRLLGLDTAEE